MFKRARQVDFTVDNEHARKIKLPKMEPSMKPRILSSYLIQSLQHAARDLFINKTERTPLLRYITDVDMRSAIWDQFQFTSIVANASIISMRSFEDSGQMGVYNFYITLVGHQSDQTGRRNMITMVARGSFRVKPTSNGDSYRPAKMQIEQYRIDVRNDKVYPTTASHGNMMVFTSGYMELKYMPCVESQYAGLSIHKPSETISLHGISETELLNSIDKKSDVFILDDYLNSESSVQYL